MFLDSFSSSENNRGWIEVICGSMFSGKTEELIRRLKRAQIANQSVAIFKPLVDTRNKPTEIISHDKRRISSIAIAEPSEIYALAQDVRVIGIDEVQFFSQEITEVVNTLADQGKRVIVAGLDMNYKGKPFGQMPQLLASAEFITKLHAICDVCGSVALYSYRKNDSAEEVQLGAKDNYEPRCRYCYKIENNEHKT